MATWQWCCWQRSPPCRSNTPFRRWASSLAACTPSIFRLARFRHHRFPDNCVREPPALRFRRGSHTHAIRKGCVSAHVAHMNTGPHVASNRYELGQKTLSLICQVSFTSAPPQDVPGLVGLALQLSDEAVLKCPSCPLPAASDRPFPAKSMQPRYCCSVSWVGETLVRSPAGAFSGPHDRWKRHTRTLICLSA